MEIRVLRYFVEIAKEGNMTRAAKNLHVSQSALSKQMKELEDELERPLFTRTKSGLSLTEAGALLHKRAEDILNMVDKTTDEFASLDTVRGGNIRIGCAESYLIKYLARTIKEFRKTYPLFHFHVSNGDTEQLEERLDKGLLDFAVIVEPPDSTKYKYLAFPGTDRWGLVMRKDHPLAKKEHITLADLSNIDLICSTQGIKGDLPAWSNDKSHKLRFIGTGDQIFNSAVSVREGLGCLLTFEYLANTSEESGLVFRPLEPPLEVKMYIIWKKVQTFTPIADQFRKKLIETYGPEPEDAGEESTKEP